MIQTAMNIQCTLQLFSLIHHSQKYDTDDLEHRHTHTSTFPNFSSESLFIFPLVVCLCLTVLPRYYF